LLLPGGRTTHSKFKISVPTLDNSVCNIFQGFELSQLLKQANLIIWDEAPMTHKYCFEALDRTLNDIMNTENESRTIFVEKLLFLVGISSKYY